MDKFEQRVLENLRHEAKAFVRKGIELPDRTPKYAALRDVYVSEETVMYGNEMVIVEQNKIKSIENRLDVEYGDEWRDWAKSLYNLRVEVGVHRVSSSAKDWKENKEWSFSNRSDALLKVEQLIQYKVYDRSRGRGDVSKDLNL